MQNAEGLFSYGTLRDADIQAALYGECLPMQAASVAHWAVFVGEDGYLFAKPLQNAKIEGMLLQLDEKQLAITDLWEQVPLYQREMVRCVTAEGRETLVWMYTKRETQGVRHHGTQIAALEKEMILQEAAELRAEVQQNGAGKCTLT